MTKQGYYWVKADGPWTIAYLDEHLGVLKVVGDMTNWWGRTLWFTGPRVDPPQEIGDDPTR